MPSSTRWRHRKSVGGRTGWTVAHVVVEDDKGRLVACAPAYVKTHSMGEYVFDHSWAHAYENAGGRYYPKFRSPCRSRPSPAAAPAGRARRAGGAREALIGGAERLREAVERPRYMSPFASAPDAEALDAAGFRAPHRRAVPFPQRRLRRFRGIPCGAGFAQAQSHQARAARGARRRHRHRLLTGSDIKSSTGTRSSLSTWTPARANGAGPI